MTPRLIEQHDLVLFTTNTGEFYQRHLLFARHHMSVDGWKEWLRDTVIPHYSRTVEPVTYDYETLINSAREVREYYIRHVNEG
jgi:hypothetical protein